MQRSADVFRGLIRVLSPALRFGFDLRFSTIRLSPACKQVKVVAVDSVLLEGHSGGVPSHPSLRSSEIGTARPRTPQPLGRHSRNSHGGGEEIRAIVGPREIAWEKFIPFLDYDVDIRR